MARWVLALVLPAMLAACSFETGGGRGGKGDWKKPKAPVTVVETAVVGRGHVSDLLLASAAVEARAAADLMPVAAGMVLEVRRDVGDAVRKGEVLAVIENVQLDAAAERTESDVRQLEARVDEMRRLFENGAVSSRELDDLEHQLRTARTALREARASAGETRIDAPFDGVVAARELRVGELASSARRAFQIVDLSALEVRARLPERDVSRVRVGQAARLVSAYDADEAATAHVTRVSPVIDPTSGTFQVTLTLDPGQDALRPGQYVSVELEVDRHEDVVVVPKEAVVYENGAPVVYRMVDAPPEEEAEDDAAAEKGGGGFSFGALFGGDDADDADADEGGEDDEEGAKEDEGPRLVARRAPLELGLTDVRWAEVVSGVDVGDKVIVVGQSNLRDGARVRAPRPGDAAARQGAPGDGDEG